MSEYKKIVHRFKLFTVWVLFFSLTLTGLITAGERTRFMITGEQELGSRDQGTGIREQGAGIRD